MNTDESSSELVSAVKTFRMRSPRRDLEIDAARLSLILKAVDGVLEQATAERSGLVERVRTIIRQPEAVLERAFRRQELRHEEFVHEWTKAEKRLGTLGRQISCLRSLRAFVLVQNPGVGSTKAARAHPATRKIAAS
jgi:hypothetical protein